jgi:hypothetical protein
LSVRENRHKKRKSCEDEEHPTTKSTLHREVFREIIWIKNITKKRIGCVSSRCGLRWYEGARRLEHEPNAFVRHATTGRHGGAVNTCFVFGRSRIQISARRPAILIEGFRGFPQSLQANAVIVP